MTPGVRPLIAGNWKMHGLRADGLALARAVAEVAAGAGGGAELLVCPPSTLLREVAAALDCEPGAPLLWIERVAVDMLGRAVELRRSWMATDRLRYAITLE